MDKPNPANQDLRPYDAEVKDGVLTITVRKEFDFGDLHQDWSKKLIHRYPGPFLQVVVDLGHCGLVSSTFLAGMLTLHFHYVKGKGDELVRMISPDPRVLRNLKIMHMDQHFFIVPRDQMVYKPTMPEEKKASTKRIHRTMRIIRPTQKP